MKSNNVLTYDMQNFSKKKAKEVIFFHEIHVIDPDKTWVSFESTFETHLLFWVHNPLVISL